MPKFTVHLCYTALVPVKVEAANEEAAIAWALENRDLTSLAFGQCLIDNLTEEGIVELVDQLDDEGNIIKTTEYEYR